MTILYIVTSQVLQKLHLETEDAKSVLIEVIWSLVKESNKSVLCNPTISSTSNFVLQPNSLLQETSPNKVKHKPALLAIVVCSQLQQLKAIAVKKLLCCRIHTIR